MTGKEIAQELRCCAEGDCKDCAEDKQRCQENLLDKAAETIERLTAENAALREKQRWISATEPPKEWKDEKTGYMINYLINCVYSGVDVGSYHAEAGCWLCRGLPVTVTHWMPMPEAPEENNAT